MVLPANAGSYVQSQIPQMMCERVVSEVVIVVLCALGSYSLLYHDELQNPTIAILEVYCKSAQAAA